MTAHYSDDRVTLWHGDCRDVLRELADESVAAVVTDPPYELGFMGRSWDASGVAYDVAVWRECLRVLRPGGHLLAFGGTRTWHRLTVAIEDSGFEIRDSITWLYASGFPKSLDVSKAIDKTRDDTAAWRVVCRWLRDRIDEHPTETVRTLAERFGFHHRMVDHWAARDTDSQPSIPTLEQWDALRSALGFDSAMDAEVLRLNLRKGEPGEAWAGRPVTGRVEEWTNRTAYALTSRDGLRRDVAATADAARWQGWGTALKPAHEPIVVARKPLAGTVAACVLEHGTGALNIDGCRVAHASAADLATSQAKNPGRVDHVTSGVYGADRPQQSVNSDGRWPANVVFTHAPDCGPDDTTPCVDGCPVAELDAQSAGYADEGGASRFFPTFRFEAKAPTSERPRVGDTAHPTVKPLDLMRWLARLVTPPAGVVLDPFAGSGTTGEAAALEGFPCWLVEEAAEHLPLITQRLTKRSDPVAHLTSRGEDLGLFDLLVDEGAPS